MHVTFAHEHLDNVKPSRPEGPWRLVIVITLLDRIFDNVVSCSSYRLSKMVIFNYNFRYHHITKNTPKPVRWLDPLWETL